MAFSCGEGCSLYRTGVSSSYTSCTLLQACTCVHSKARSGLIVRRLGKAENAASDGGWAPGLAQQLHAK